MHASFENKFEDLFNRLKCSSLKHKYTLMFCIPILVIFIVPIIIWILYFIGDNYVIMINTSLKVGEALTFYATMLVGSGTLILSFIAVRQNIKANEINKRLFDLEWRKLQPCFEILDNKIFQMRFHDEIINYERQIETDKNIIISPAYLCNNGQGVFSTTVAQIELDVTNSGNSDIREIVFEELDISIIRPKNKKGPILLFSGIESKTGIKINEYKKLIINIEEEMDEESWNLYENKKDWTTNLHPFSMLRLAFKLKIITKDGFKYKEELTMSSSYNRKLKNTENLLEGISNIKSVKIS
jgi:hypothetical protein